jgi:hypothetical protein
VNTTSDELAFDSLPLPPLRVVVRDRPWLVASSATAVFCAPPLPTANASLVSWGRSRSLGVISVAIVGVPNASVTVTRIEHLGPQRGAGAREPMRHALVASAPRRASRLAFLAGGDQLELPRRRRAAQPYARLPACARLAARAAADAVCGCGGVPGTAPHRIASHRTASHRIAPHRTASHRVASHRTAPHRAASRRVASRRIASHRVAYATAYQAGGATLSFETSSADPLYHQLPADTARSDETNPSLHRAECCVHLL